jgi:hypothetical protein
MNFFDLPARTKVGRVIPKNAFEKYSNAKQKKLFKDGIKRITWTHKLSTDTINLPAGEVTEIQLFKIELKSRLDILKLLELISKAIPYHIIFWVTIEEQAYISTVAKHPHPTNEDVAVIDWVFTSDWFSIEETPYQLNLKTSLDAVFKDVCIQLSEKPELDEQPIDVIIQKQQQIDRLQKKKNTLATAIKRSKQFKEKVELNMQLKEVEKELEGME